MTNLCISILVCTFVCIYKYWYMYTRSVMYTSPQPTRPHKVLNKGALNLPPPSLEKLNFYFRRFLINSLEILIFQLKLKWKDAKIAQIFITSLYFFLIIFSYIMSYDCPILLCIKVSICEPISIRYAPNSDTIWQNSKT